MAEGLAGFMTFLLGVAILYGFWWIFKAVLGGADEGGRPGSRTRTRSGRRLSWTDLQAERTVRTASGLMVRSKAERRIADLLDELGIAYEYERKLHGFYPDFYVAKWDLVIEYWGMDAPGSENRQRKVAAYLRGGHKLINLENEDWTRLEDALLKKLYAFDQDVYRRRRAAPRSGR